MHQNSNRKKLLKSIDEENQKLESIIKYLECENEKLRLKNKKKVVIIKEIQEYIRKAN